MHRVQLQGKQQRTTRSVPTSIRLYNSCKERETFVLYDILRTGTQQRITRSVPTSIRLYNSCKERETFVLYDIPRTGTWYGKILPSNEPDVLLLCFFLSKVLRVSYVNQCYCLLAYRLAWRPSHIVSEAPAGLRSGRRPKGMLAVA